MESFFSRYRNLIVLLLVLLAQVIGLAMQVRKPAATQTAALPVQSKPDGRGVLLIRLWAASLVTPFERGFHGVSEGAAGLWNNYVDLRHTREQNKELQATIDRLQLEEAELREDALEGQRLQGLVKFQEGYAYATTPAQVIGTSGSSQSRVLYLDKGSSDGLAPDMAVISSDGIVGKVRDVFAHSAQVLLINDQTSGAGVILEKTRIRGILRGNAAGQPQVINILSDQRIQPGEPVLTAGGDQIFPRGLPVGVVDKVVRDPERSGFIEVVVKPAAALQHLDEVLVITSLEAHFSKQQQADLETSEELKGAEAAAEAERKKAALELEERLPGLNDPNAPQTQKNSAGADGKADPDAPPNPTAPKPLAAKHPDRFSPGGAGDSAGADSGEQPDASQSGDVTDKAQPKPQGTKPAVPKTANPSTPGTKPQASGRPQSQ
jgi:rod shape-determining protein MreC